MVLNCRGAPAHFWASTTSQSRRQKTDGTYLLQSRALPLLVQPTIVFFFSSFCLMYQFFWMKMINDNNFSTYAWSVASNCNIENSSMRFLFTIHTSRAVWRNLMMRNWQLSQRQLNQNQRTWVRANLSRQYRVNGMRRRAMAHLWWAGTQREQKLKVIGLRSCFQKSAKKTKRETIKDKAAWYTGGRHNYA